MAVTEESQKSPPGTEPTSPDADAEFVHDDALVEEMDIESFPGSDPPSTWAGHDRPPPDET